MIESQRLGLEFSTTFWYAGAVMRILILGGTLDARRLAEHLAGDHRFQPILSLAGRTADPISSPIKTRIGGFGGADGLRAWIVQQKIDAVVDVTHPFADQISANAVLAAQACGVRLGSFIRPAWTQVAGDNWIEVSDANDAIAALGDTPMRVFLTVGRLGVSDFAAAPQHTYVARTIDPPHDRGLPPNISFRRDRGPFTRDGEVDLMRSERIDIVVSKNSGGPATYAKIEAARHLGLPVVMISRPHKPRGQGLSDIDAVVLWLEDLLHIHSPPLRSERDV